MVYRAAALAGSSTSAASASEDSSVWSRGRPAVPGQTTVSTLVKPPWLPTQCSRVVACWRAAGLSPVCHCRHHPDTLTRHSCCASCCHDCQDYSSVWLRHSCSPCGPCMLGRTRWTFSSL